MQDGILKRVGLSRWWTGEDLDVGVELLRLFGFCLQGRGLGGALCHGSLQERSQASDLQ